MNEMTSRDVAERTLPVGKVRWLALATLAVSWTALTPGLLHAQLPENTGPEYGTWVAVNYEAAGRATSVNGFVNQTQYFNLVSGNQRGFVTIDHVFSENIDGFHYWGQVDGAPGRKRSTQIRATAIYEVQPLQEDYIKKAFSKEERDRALARIQKQEERERALARFKEQSAQAPGATAIP